MNPSYSSSPYGIDSCLILWKVLADFSCPGWYLGMTNLPQRMCLKEYLLISPSAGTQQMEEQLTRKHEVDKGRPKKPGVERTGVIILH